MEKTKIGKGKGKPGGRVNMSCNMIAKEDFAKKEMSKGN